MGLVERQKVIDAIIVEYNTEDSDYPTDYQLGLAKAKQIIAEMPSAQPEQQWIDAIREVIKCSGSDGFIIVPKDGTEGWDENGVHYMMQPERNKGEWIPCSERLPEIGVNVLTVWTYEEFEPAMVVACLKEWNGELYFDDVFGEYDHELKDVPAWMPLPEPWKGEEHG